MNKTDRPTLILVVFLGLALLAAAVISTINEREAVAQIEFWRRMYLAADHDAKYVNCVELDDNFVICEKPRS